MISTIYYVIRRRNSAELALALAQLSESGQASLRQSQALAVAVCARHHAAIDTLIKIGACPNATVELETKQRHRKTRLKNMSPVCIAAYIGDPLAVELLLLAGADPHLRSCCGLTPLLASCRSEGSECFKLLVDQSDLFATTFVDSDNALMLACKAGNVAVIDCLLERNFPLDCKSAKGFTALHYVASRHGRCFSSKIMQLLVRAGASNLPNAFGVTPACQAAQYQQQCHLLDAGDFSEYEHVSCALVAIFATLAPPPWFRHDDAIDVAIASFRELLRAHCKDLFIFFAQRPYLPLQQLLSDAGFSERTDHSVAAMTRTDIAVQCVIQLERYCSACSSLSIHAAGLLVIQQPQLLLPIVFAMLQELLHNLAMSSRQWDTAREFLHITDLILYGSAQAEFPVAQSTSLLAVLFRVAILISQASSDSAKDVLRRAVDVMTHTCRRNAHILHCPQLPKMLLQFHLDAYNNLLSPYSVYHLVLFAAPDTPCPENSTLSLLVFGIENISNINFVDEFGSTLLSRVCTNDAKYGFITAKLLARPDIDVDIVDNHGHLPLRKLVSAKVLEAMQDKITLQCLAARRVPRNSTRNLNLPAAICEKIELHRNWHEYEKFRNPSTWFSRAVALQKDAKQEIKTEA